MANEAAESFLSDLMQTVQDSVREMAQAQQQWALITATGSAAGKRVTVVVNAEGVVIETRFTSDADQMSLTELARGVTAAAQEAAAAARQKVSELMAPAQANSAAVPKVSDFFPDLPDVGELFPKPVQALTSPPDSLERNPDRATARTARGADSEELSDIFDGRGL
ncbi:YbaB/EbfC family nucleoid-associated protein [Nocardia alni]|uniref:YbaB/EbfC family nucleoid-associated protein n=1 Tax=Nocardia alni TaxID=2815723 RepID=UPI001C21B80F|nr:YbaB/EbfC family nucleoid-associated protein [Nocardia alni]